MKTTATPAEPQARVPTYAESAEFFRTKFGSKVRVLTVQDSGREIAGVLVIDQEITSLYVEPEFRGKGIASSLINAAMVPDPNLSLICTRELIPFYARLGFVVSGRCEPNGYRMDTRW